MNFLERTVVIGVITIFCFGTLTMTNSPLKEKEKIEQNSTDENTTNRAIDKDETKEEDI